MYLHRTMTAGTPHRRYTKRWTVFCKGEAFFVLPYSITISCEMFRPYSIFFPASTEIT